MLSPLRGWFASMLAPRVPLPGGRGVEVTSSRLVRRSAGCFGPMSPCTGCYPSASEVLPLRLPGDSGRSWTGNSSDRTTKRRFAPAHPKCCHSGYGTISEVAELDVAGLATVQTNHETPFCPGESEVLPLRLRIVAALRLVRPAGWSALFFSDVVAAACSHGREPMDPGSQRSASREAATAGMIADRHSTGRPLWVGAACLRHFGYVSPVRNLTTPTRSWVLNRFLCQQFFCRMIAFRGHHLACFGGITSLAKMLSPLRCSIP